MCSYANESFRKNYYNNNSYEDILRKNRDIVSRVIDAVEEGYSIRKALNILKIHHVTFQRALTDEDKVVLAQLLAKNKAREENKKKSQKPLTKEEFREAMLEFSRH